MNPSATDQIENQALALVAAGEAANVNDAVALVVAAEPALYKAACGEAVRPPDLREIDQELSRIDPSARERLQGVADALLLMGKAPTEVDSMVMAIRQNPNLYQ